MKGNFPNSKHTISGKKKRARDKLRYARDTRDKLRLCIPCYVEGSRAMTDKSLPWLSAGHDNLSTRTMVGWIQPYTQVKNDVRKGSS